MGMPKQDNSFKKLWNYQALGVQQIRDFILLIIGAGFALILQPNASVQNWLYSFVPQSWRWPMGIIIIVIVIILLALWMRRLDKKESKIRDRDSAILMAIAKKLGVTDEDIEKEQ